MEEGCGGCKDTTFRSMTTKHDCPGSHHCMANCSRYRCVVTDFGTRLSDSCRHIRWLLVTLRNAMETIGSSALQFVVGGSDSHQTSGGGAPGGAAAQEVLLEQRAQVQQLQAQLSAARAEAFLASVAPPPAPAPPPPAPPAHSFSADDLNNGAAPPRIPHQAPAADSEAEPFGRSSGAGQHPEAQHAAAAVDAASPHREGPPPITTSQLAALQQRLGFLEAQNTTLQAANAAAAAVAAAAAETGGAASCASGRGQPAPQPRPVPGGSPASSPKTPGAFPSQRTPSGAH